MINKKASNVLSEVIKWNERIIIATFEGNPKTTITFHYLPVEGDDEAEQHYNQLSSAVKQVPKHNILIVLGDFNAHLDKNLAKYSYHGTSNANGKLVNNFIQESNLFVANASFQKKPAKLWAYISDMSSRKTQVDYIMVNKNWKNSVHNCQSYNTFSSLESDHRVVIMKMKLRFRPSKTVSRGKNYDWFVLKNKEIKDNYTIELKNRSESPRIEIETSTETYENLIQTNKETAKELIPKKSKTKQMNIANDRRIINARKNASNSVKLYFEDPNETNRLKMQEDKKALTDAYDSVSEEQFEKVIRDVEVHDANSRPKKCWNLINIITGKKSSKQGIIKAKDKKDQLNKWYVHFKNLLGNEPIVEGSPEENITPVINNLMIPDGPFTREEYTKVKKESKNGKICGPNGIPPEVFKYCDLDDIMLEFASNLLNGHKPAQWSKSDLKPLRKSGDLSSTEKYRGISLSLCYFSKDCEQTNFE